MSEWKPIETAPKEVDEQILYGRFERNGEWRADLYWSLSNPEIYRFTHWSRIPAPPQR